MRPNIAVVIVTYNSEDVVVDLLDSLPEALGDLSAETIVVDNGSSDGTVGVLSKRTDCRVIECHNRGYAAGINAGVAASSGSSAILVLNPDVRMAPKSVQVMVDALSEPATGIVVPRIINPDGSLFRSVRREPDLLNAAGLGFTGLPIFSEYVSNASDYLKPVAVDWALGAVMLVSTACHDALGGWDESYFLYSEETDLCLRARDHGQLTRYVPNAVAMHIGGQSGTNDRIHTMQILNRVRLYRRRHGRVASTIFYALTLLSEMSWVIRGQRKSRASVRALLIRRHRPEELRCSDRLMPR